MYCRPRLYVRSHLLSENNIYVQQMKVKLTCFCSCYVHAVCVCLMHCRIHFSVKKSGQKTIKFSEGRGNVTNVKSSAGGLAVSIAPGLPIDARMTSRFFMLTLRVL